MKMPLVLQKQIVYRKNDNEIVFKQIKLFVNYYVSFENKVNVYQFVHVLCNSTDH